MNNEFVRGNTNEINGRYLGEIIIKIGNFELN